jgi:hypothetical protein
MVVWVKRQHLPLHLMSQSALGPDGQLLDASEIEWYNDTDDVHPIQVPPTPNIQTGAEVI